MVKKKKKKVKRAASKRKPRKGKNKVRRVKKKVRITRKVSKKKSLKRTKKRVIKKVKKKTATRKKSKKRVVKKVSVARKAPANLIGVVTHYFPHVNAAVIKLKAPLSAGDTIRIKGHTTDFTQTVNSLQIDRVPITQAKKGQEVGLSVTSRVRHNDIVTKP